MPRSARRETFPNQNITYPHCSTASTATHFFFAANTSKQSRRATAHPIHPHSSRHPHIIIIASSHRHRKYIEYTHTLFNNHHRRRLRRWLINCHSPTSSARCSTEMPPNICAIVCEGDRLGARKARELAANEVFRKVCVCGLGGGVATRIVLI